MVFGNALLSPIFHLGALTSSLYLLLVLLSFSLQKQNDLYLTYQTDLLYEICDYVLIPSYNEQATNILHSIKCHRWSIKC